MSHSVGQVAMLYPAQVNIVATPNREAKNGGPLERGDVCIANDRCSGDAMEAVR